MNGQVQFYVNGMHSIGGVTTWSFQAANCLASRYQTRVITVNEIKHKTAATFDEDLFPGEVTKIWRQTSGSYASKDDTPKNPSTMHPSNKPSEPANPNRRIRKPVKPTKPIRPVKPTKIPIEPPDAPNGGDQEDANNLSAQANLLHASAEGAIEEAKVFVPNYLDFGYKLAATSRARGIASRCIGICHCDQENYYQLLTHYAPIIQSFIAVSPRCLLRLAACLPDRQSDMRLLPYGVATPAARPTTNRSGPIRLLYSGRIAHRQKRVFDLVAIVHQLNARRVNYSLDVVGVGPDRQALMSELDGAPQVRFWPGVSQVDISSVYRNHDAFLLPSETEGTSIALLESMVHGLVPIATRVSGSEDVIIDAVNGFLCEVGDVCCMADCIATLADAPALLNTMAINARRQISEHYQKDVQLRAFEQCVKETLQKPLASVDAAVTVLNGEASAVSLT